MFSGVSLCEHASIARFWLVKFNKSYNLPRICTWPRAVDVILDRENLSAYISH